jgi:hypothetical protein
MEYMVVPFVEKQGDIPKTTDPKMFVRTESQTKSETGIARYDMF